jgi:hypothetical protein
LKPISDGIAAPVEFRDMLGKRTGQQLGGAVSPARPQLVKIIAKLRNDFSGGRTARPKIALLLNRNG